MLVEGGGGGRSSGGGGGEETSGGGGGAARSGGGGGISIILVFFESYRALNGEVEKSRECCCRRTSASHRAEFLGGVFFECLELSISPLSCTIRRKDPSLSFGRSLPVPLGQRCFTIQNDYDRFPPLAHRAYPKTQQSHDFSAMTTPSQGQRLHDAIWEGSLPVEIRLSASECRIYDQADPYLVRSLELREPSIKD